MLVSDSPSRFCGSLSLFPLLLVLGSCLVVPNRALAQGRRAGNVQVHVVDENGQGVPEAEVRLYQFSYGSYMVRQTADEGGTAEFTRVAPDDYQLEASKPGYETVRERIDVSAGMTVSATLTLKVISDPHTPSSPARLISAGTLAVPEPARKEFEAGMAGMDKDPAASIEHFRKATEMYPNFSLAYAWLGLAYMAKKQSADAVGAEQKAIALDSKLSLAHTILGKVYLEDRRFAEAETELLRGIDLDPNGWQAPFDLSRCYYNTGKLEKALEYARKAHEAPQSSPKTHLLLADIYLRKGAKGDALRELNEFTKADPQNPMMARVQRKIEELSKPN